MALQQDGALQQHPKYVVFSLVFILFGLTVVSAAMNLLVLRFLTMNTEDERRDEQEAQLAARGLVRVEGDIITANGALTGSGPPKADTLSDSDAASVCSCSCYQLPYAGTAVTGGGVRSSRAVQLVSPPTDRSRLSSPECSDDEHERDSPVPTSSAVLRVPAVTVAEANGSPSPDQNENLDQQQPSTSRRISY